MNPINTALPMYPSMMSSSHSPPPNPNPNPMQEQQAIPKKRRNLPGTPDPEAEVVALSPQSLMAKNRYVCEACGKGFQREQNLQLHRRGHNLPWKLRQKGAGGQEPRRKVYVCPVEVCVHHDAARALGDLTGIKKHYSRKHGEKRWKCERCSKKYAVQSDWKAHCRTCGTRQYTCDCGTVFARKDSFVTHRAFCDALVQETARLSSSDAADRHFRFEQAAPNNGSHQSASVGGDHDHQLGPVHLPSSHLMLPPPTLTMADGAMHTYSNGVASSPSASALSATALLQKAAQMGAVGSCASSSLFAGFAGSSTVDAPFMVSEQQPRPELPLDGSYWNNGGGAELTRDFLGVGAAEEECFRQPFASPELTGMCSPLDVLGSSMFKTCN